MNGRVVHFEVPFNDGERARAFYREAFGWSIDEMPELNYSMVSTGPRTEQGMPSEPGFINGGMFDRAGASAPNPVITISVDSIDAALNQIGQLGGLTVTDKMPVGDMGFAAYFTDTEGNVMGLWENAAS